MRRKGQNKRASILRSAGSIVVDALESRRFFDVVLFYDGDWGAAQAQNSAVIGDPIGVSNGVLTLNTTDIQSTGFGTPWGISRSWGNQPGLSKTSDDVGNGWVINQNPQIFHSYNGSTTVLKIVDSASSAMWFTANSDGSFTPWFNLRDTLTYNGDDDFYTLTDLQGDQTNFYGFGETYGASGYAGTFESYQPASGNLISVTSHTSSGAIQEEQRQQSDGSTTITESYLYSYGTDGNLTNVLLRRRTGSGSWIPIRQAAYTYYTSDGEYGLTDDLQTAAEEDGSGNILSEDYYRYSGGTYDNLILEFTGPDFARLLQNQGSSGAIFNASNSTVAPYATLNLSYGTYITVVPAGPQVIPDIIFADGRHASPATTQTITYENIIGEVVGGVGGTDTGTEGAGLGTYSFNINTSAGFVFNTSQTFAPDGISAGQYNLVASETVETLPNGLVDTYYSNYAGQVILSQESGSTGTRYSYNQYDDSDNLISTADPKAISYAVVNSSTGVVSVGYSGSGQIETWDYPSSSSATNVSAGTAVAYPEDVKVQSTSGGASDLLESFDYKAQTVGSATVYYLADDTLYRNASANGSGGETTCYLNTYYTGTFAIASTVETLPTVGATQNGSGVATTDTQLFDADGNLVWEKDPNGYVSYTAYNIPTGAVTESIDDVNSADAPSSPAVAMPSGWNLSGDSLALITQYTVDAEGRTTEEIGPNLNASYTVYNDSNHSTIVYPGWHQISGSAYYTTTGPVQVELDDWADGYTDSFSFAYTPTTASTPGTSFTIGTLQSLTRDITDTSGQVVEEDNYSDLSGINYSTGSAYLGTLNTNYYATLYAYDAGGNLDRVQSSNGTIDRTVYDEFNEPIQTWIGAVVGGVADDADWPDSTGNMMLVSQNVYDADGNEFETVQYPGGSANMRITMMYYDFRDRLIAEMDGAVPFSSTTVGGFGDDAILSGSPLPGVADTSDNDTFVTYYTLDNISEVTDQDTYNAEGQLVTFGTATINGDITNSPANGSTMVLTAASSWSYDDQGRVYQSKVISVDPVTHDPGTALATQNYYDADGNVIATISPTGSATKYAYNGADWLTATYQTDGGQVNNFSNVSIGSSTAFAAAASLTGDIVLSQTLNDYDNDGNVIETIEKDRLGADSTSSTGALGTPTAGIEARVSYAASYYDAADRDIADVNVGTNGGSAWTRPANAPTGSSTVLVSSYIYDTAGRLSFRTDPLGLISAYAYNALGETTATIADWTASTFVGPVDTSSLPTPTGSTNQTTMYTYDGDGNVISMNASTGTVWEDTHYIYGVNISQGSLVDSNDLLYKVEYPDPITGTNTSSGTYNQAETYTYDALGEQNTYLDRNGTTHTYAYDQLGRLTTDSATSGSGVDSTVTELGYTYTDQGQLYQATSFNTGGGIINQVQEGYDGFGQLASDAQSHSGAVADDGSTPEVDYDYDSTNNDRLTDIVYPDGRDITYDYGTGLDSVLSRVSSIDDETGSIQTYSYLGLNTPIGFTDENGVTESTTLDDFGRISSMVYTNSSSGTVDSFSYGYDADGNVLYKKNGVLTNQSALYSYDNLNRLTNYSTGTLNSSNTSISGAPTETEGWSLDAQGNWASNTLNGVTINRNTSSQNQVTAVGTTSLTYDANGNLKTDQNGNTYVYDAWNHLISVTVGTDTISYTYDALGRRITEGDSSSGTTTDFYYSGQQIVQQVAVDTSDDTTTDEYVWSPFYVNQLIQRNEFTSTSFTPLGEGAHGSSDDITGILFGTQTYAEQDADYNVTSLTNSSGGVVERYIYDPYGSVTVLTASGSVLGTGMASSTVGEVVGYQGGYEDPKTGLVHFQVRDDDTGLGRWIEQDPARYVNGPSVYQFVVSNPVGRVDPSGLGWTDGWGQALLSTVGLADDDVQEAYDESVSDRTLGTADAVVSRATLGTVNSVGGPTYDQANRDDANSTAGLIIDTDLALIGDSLPAGCGTAKGLQAFFAAQNTVGGARNILAGVRAARNPKVTGVRAYMQLGLGIYQLFSGIKGFSGLTKNNCFVAGTLVLMAPDADQAEAGTDSWMFIHRRQMVAVGIGVGGMIGWYLLTNPNRKKRAAVAALNANNESSEELEPAWIPLIPATWQAQRQWLMERFGMTMLPPLYVFERLDARRSTIL